MANAKEWVVLAAVLAAATVGGCKKAEEAKVGSTASDAGTPPTRGSEVAAAAPSRPERPAFRERMTPEEFDRHYKGAAAMLPPVAEREKVKGAAWGYLLNAVDPGSQAEKVGLHAGDTIVAIDGQRAWSEQRLGQLRTDVPQKFTVVGEDLKPREVTVQPGRIGIRGERHWDAELVYLRGPHRDGRWDDLVRLALANMWDDPKMAETAMMRALAKGYPADGISDLIGYALSVSRPESAADTLLFARLREGSGEYGADIPVWPRGRYWAAVAEGDLDTAAEAMRDAAPDVLDDRSAQIARLVEVRGPATRPTGPTPSAVAGLRKRIPMIRECQPINEYTRWYLERMNKGESLRFASQSGHYMPFVIKPLRPSKEVVVEIRFRIRPHDREKSDYAKMFAVGLMDLADQRPTESLDRDGMPGGILGLAAWGNKETVSIYHGYGEELAWRPSMFKMDGSEEVSVRLVHAGGWDEVFVNDDRIALLPWTAPCKKMALYVKTVGMDAMIPDLQFDLLEEEGE